MRLTPCLLLLALGLAACRTRPGAPQPPPPALAPDAQGQLKGRVAERLEAPPYCYLRLVSGKAEAWAAVPQAPLAVGSEAVVVNSQPMANFESRSLRRTFALVHFGTLQAAAADPQGARGLQHALAAQGPSDVVVPKVARAAGADARTVAEVFAQREALKDRSVTLQGQVVKVNLDIMGRNWMHLRDGSGQGPTADLTFTSKEKAEVGEVVVVRGTVRLDKDFGAGYRYPVIVEDAKLARPSRR